MLTLPLPILTFVLAAVACALLWRLEIGNTLARRLFTAAFAVIAAGTLLTGLRFGYGLQQLVALQRMIPLCVGPLIYLGFAALSRPAEAMPPLVKGHLGVAALAALVPQLLPVLRPGLDLLIAASYLIYASLLLVLWRRGSEALTHAALQAVPGLRHWMLGACTLLLAMLVFDIGIAISFALQHAGQALALISYGSVLLMGFAVLAIVVLARRRAAPVVVGPAQASARPGADTRQSPEPAGIACDVDPDSLELEKAARLLLNKTRLYLDKGLTLDRLAKRLHVPARSLSRAINQTQAQNVSRYVNGFRASHAASLLATSDLSVTAITDQSGFLSRSNFYREFERIYGCSPKAYRAQMQQQGG